MKKAITLILLLGLSASIYAQFHESCHILKTDNSKLIGEAKMPKMDSKTINIYINNERTKIKVEEIRELRYFIESDTIIFQPVLTYKSNNKKVNKQASLLELVKVGATNLYFAYASNYNQPDMNIWFMKKKEDEIAYFISKKYTGPALSIGHNNTFKKNALEYLSDYNELCNKIEEGTYKLKDIETVVELYNNWKANCRN